LTVRKPDDRLCRLIEMSDELENSIESALRRENDVKDLKDIASLLKEAVAIKRNLLDIPTQAERESQRLARAKFRADHPKGKRESDLISVEFSDVDYSE